MSQIPQREREAEGGPVAQILEASQSTAVRQDKRKTEPASLAAGSVKRKDEAQ